MGGRKWLNVNLHKTTDGGVGRWLASRVVGVGQCRCRATSPIRLFILTGVLYSISDRAEVEPGDPV